MKSMSNQRCGRFLCLPTWHRESFFASDSPAKCGLMVFVSLAHLHTVQQSPLIILVLLILDMCLHIIKVNFSRGES